MAARRREFAAPLGEFRRTPVLVPLGTPPPTSTTPIPDPTHTGCPPLSAGREEQPLDRLQCASASALYGDKGEFLIPPPLSDGSGIGWAAVADPVGAHLPSRIAAVTGSPEFLAVSMDSQHLCAAWAEEDDYWVVQRELS
ncbi:hypothetical protein ACFXKC_40585 [Streptomyces sp. NPDC059340]|uniref:hypothetical protein n=1 Tax=Streptomyces sp. NPDC059340 TaxID=3346806 RepID=UPI0036BE131F